APARAPSSMSAAVAGASPHPARSEGYPPPAPGGPARAPEARRSWADRGLAGVLAVVVSRPSRSPAPAPAAAVPTALSYTFTPEQYPDGLLIVRRWTL